MTKPLPYTQDAIVRAIRGIEKAGRFAVGVRVCDGVVLVADKPLDVASLVPENEQNVPASKWEDQQGA